MDLQDEAHTEDKRLDQAEVALGDHVTGGVVQSWRRVQKRLGDILSEGKHSLISLFESYFVLYRFVFSFNLFLPSQ